MWGNHKRLFLFVVLLLVIAFVVVTAQVFRLNGIQQNLRVVFLDVGQGDATFITSPTNTQVLIDGGRDGTILRRLPDIMSPFDRTIDLVVVTHPDADHINGLVEVFERYEVLSVLMTDNKNDTPSYDALMSAIQKESATVHIAKRGQVFDLGAGLRGSTTLTILFPDRDVRGLESNTSSIVGKLSYGETDFMFTADAPDAIEVYVADLDGAALKSEVLKVGHHGSRTSSDPYFLDVVQPKYAVISAGKDNDYGHPHKDVLDRLEARSIQTVNTADVGSVFLESNGISISTR